MKRFFVLVVLVALLGCTTKSEKSQPNRVLKVVTTIGLVSDPARRPGGPGVAVTALMGPGVDPHLYKASEGDVRRLSESDLILYNGLNLEGKMGYIFVKMSRTRPVIPISEFIDPSLLREPPEFQGHYDPHIWFDVSLWMKAVDRVRDALIELRPQHRQEITDRANSYRAKLEELHQWVKKEIGSIPKTTRVLVTAHDAFGYFGRQYDIDVVGLQGISTATEAGVGDVNRIVDMILSKNVKAIFVETSVPKRTIEAVQAACKSKGREISIGGTLFSD